MVVVDTNVLAYLLIAGDRTREVQALFARDAEWRSESFILVELSNLLVTYVRTGALTRRQADDLLAEATKLMRGLISVPHRRALGVALDHGVSAYDARFLAAAETLRARLVTEDTRLRLAAPTRTLSVAEALAF